MTDFPLILSTTLIILQPHFFFIIVLYVPSFFQNHPPLAPREHRTAASGVGGTGQQAGGPAPMGLAVLDAFTQVAEVLEEARRQHSALSIAIEDMPSYGNKNVLPLLTGS